MKKHLRYIYILGGTMGIVLLSAAAPLLASAQSTASSSVITLSLGDKNVAVAVLQQLLIRNQYLVLSAPTGYFGTQTQSAVEAFQKAHGLPETGVFTIPSNLISTFFASVGSSTDMSFGTTSVHVKSLQVFLIDNGYLNLSTPTEYFGNLTLAAVEAFQKAHGLPQTGVVDTATFNAMNGNM